MCVQHGLRGAVSRRVDHFESHARRVERCVLRVWRRDGCRRTRLLVLRERRHTAMGSRGVHRYQTGRRLRR